MGRAVWKRKHSQLWIFGKLISQLLRTAHLISPVPNSLLQLLSGNLFISDCQKLHCFTFTVKWKQLELGFFNDSQIEGKTFKKIQDTKVIGFHRKVLQPLQWRLDVLKARLSCVFWKFCMWWIYSIDFNMAVMGAHGW